MSIVPPHYVHMLARRTVDGHHGWVAPYEIQENDPSGAGLVIAVDSSARPFPEYWLDVRLADEKGTELLYYIFRPTQDGGFKLETPGADLDFVERSVEPEARALPYLGSLCHPDFAYRFVEVQPVLDDVYELFFGGPAATLIGCDPFQQYRRRDGTSLG